jgi:preprotein translocase subunit SecG
VQTLILTLHVVVCLLLIVLVLLQAGKEGMGVIFGGGSSSVFGSGGAGGMLSKLTAFIAALFILTSLSYNLVSSNPASEKSVILDVKTEEVPAAPAVPPAAPVDPLDKAGTPAK